MSFPAKCLHFTVHKIYAVIPITVVKYLWWWNTVLRLLL